ncbi:MAG: hypothetical protein Q8L87_01200 [Anaerolineales bacterium]|jgi:uncharacterized membrane protein YfcA|nr:hypothetical protein [Chloroflexota bacterium]MDP1544608.1 hypothetical protein [Anaerolineales bacterium]
MEVSANLGLGGVIAFVAGIAVLVKLFQKEGFLKGILGFICMLYTFIWGLQNMKNEELKLKTWMYVWMAGIVIGLIINFTMGGGAE